MPWFNNRPASLAPQSGLLSCLMLTLVYVIAGRLGLLLAVPPGYATAIFPSAGIAMAAALIGGPRMLPWIFAGSFLLNLWVGTAIASEHAAVFISLAVWIAAASTGQAALGAWLLQRHIGYPTALDNARDLGWFLLIAPLSCLASASFSLAGIAALGVIDTAQVAANWFSWWIGDTLGVLFFLPLIMVLAGEPCAFWRSRASFVAVPMLVFFALFVAIFIRTRGWERDQALTEFELLSQGFSDRLQFELAAQAGALEQLSASWSRPVPETRADFATLATPLMARTPAVQAVEWAPRISEADRAGFEATQQQDVPGFAIRARAPDGMMIPADSRHDYYPVTFLEPLRGNESALGYDLASDPVRATAIQAAQRSGTIAATAPIRLVQQPSDPTGVLLTLAVKQGPNGPGVLIVVLRVDTFARSLLGAAGEAIGVRIADQQTGQSLFNTLPRGTVAAKQQSISFGGRLYRIGTAPTPLYLEQHQSWQSWMVLVTGVLSTSLLGALLMLGTGERHRFARLLAERTRERNRIWQVSEDLLGVSNFEGYFISVNPAWTRTLGWTEQEIKTLHVNALRHPDDLPIGTEGRRRLAEGAGTVRMENRFRHKDGSYRWIYWTLTEEQGLIYVIGRNVTADKEAARQHRQTEAQLRQLQKTDAIGQLTGGIAHDFNNLLTIIIGNLDILSSMLTDAPARTIRAVQSAIGGATRAATLTQRLLAYAQRQPLRPGAVDLKELVTGMQDLISRTQGEIIRCSFLLREMLPLCFCDANQLETALLNLAINARDAMPEGGSLRIETSSIHLDHVEANARGITSGRYVILAVSDTGVGMSRETAEHAFEPFFTTKEPGKGTGLGLSMVYGFVKQSNGHVEIYSEPGKGTTVRIFLPALAADMAAEKQAVDTTPGMADVQGGGEAVLIAEDDDGVRSFVAGELRKLGYHVLEADDAATALAVIEAGDRQIDLLLTDVVMPGMNGRELANRARALLPNVQVLFMTGYSQTGIEQQGRIDPDIELIEKPFRSEDLIARVRRMLDATAGPRGAVPESVER